MRRACHSHFPGTWGPRADRRVECEEKFSKDCLSPQPGAEQTGTSCPEPLASRADALVPGCSRHLLLAPAPATFVLCFPTFVKLFLCHLSLFPLCCWVAELKRCPPVPGCRSDEGIRLSGKGWKGLHLGRQGPPLFSILLSTPGPPQEAVMGGNHTYNTPNFLRGPHRHFHPSSMRWGPA